MGRIFIDDHFDEYTDKLHEEVAKNLVEKCLPFLSSFIQLGKYSWTKQLEDGRQLAAFFDIKTLFETSNTVEDPIIKHLIQQLLREGELSDNNFFVEGNSIVDYTNASTEGEDEVFQWIFARLNFEINV
mgnify:CR=1 FL=1